MPRINAAVSFSMRSGLFIAQVLVRRHVVPVDERVAPLVAEDCGDLAGSFAHDTPSFVRRIGNKAAAELASVGRADDDGIATVERAIDPGHAGRQEAFAVSSAFAAPASRKIWPFGTSWPEIQRFFAVTGSDFAMNQVTRAPSEMARSGW